MTRRQFVGSVIALMAAWLVGRKTDLRRMLAGLQEPQSTIAKIGGLVGYDQHGRVWHGIVTDASNGWITVDFA